jgi:hypothetical protein
VLGWMPSRMKICVALQGDQRSHGTAQSGHCGCRAHAERLTRKRTFTEETPVFLNEDSRAYEMWKPMMQAGEEFIARSLLRLCISPERAQPMVSQSSLRTWLTITSTLCRNKASLS